MNIRPGCYSYPAEFRVDSRLSINVDVKLADETAWSRMMPMEIERMREVRNRNGNDLRLDMPTYRAISEDGSTIEFWPTPAKRLECRITFTPQLIGAA
jgi:hypothetical protein